ncbi:NAD(P)/FAD-dependent oxidoreductase [Streptomyces cyaneofuscatus]|uniref:NAD(P)/FAD-dependent oxidoreductase n=1 Tax=Streptomyces cyaneofuscatus TaxID=66883 RepID=UPI00365CD55D
MSVQGADVLVIGAGAVGRSLAFALAVADPALRVVLAGATAGSSDGAASGAAGAMLGALGEVTDQTGRTRHGRLRTELAIEAAGRWPLWREQIRAHAGPAAPRHDGYGTGTFMVLNAVSSAMDDASHAAVARTAAEYGLGCEDTVPADIPGYRPLDNDRALRAWYLPAEGFIDARAWLTTLDAALTNLTRIPPGTLTVAPGGGYLVTTHAGVFRAPRAVVAAGAWTTPLLQALDPDLPVVPVLAAAGTAVTVTGPQTRPAVVRTPNRAYACGLHAVPQADGTLYLGASAHPALTPTTRLTAGALRFLLDAALSQLDHRLAAALIARTHHGNRPLALDGHPVIGPTSREGLWVASGTHRDGLHASPLIASTLADALLAPTTTPLPGPLAAFTPCRELISDLTVKEAAAEAAAHHAALAAESRMRPPLTGSWPQALTDAYAARMENAYAAMPDGYVPPPDLAPLAYEDTGPALAELAAAHLARHDRARP